MTHGNKTRGKKTDDNVTNIDEPSPNLVQNIIDDIITSVNSLRDEFLNLEYTVIKKYTFAKQVQIIRRQGHQIRLKLIQL